MTTEHNQQRTGTSGKEQAASAIVHALSDGESHTTAQIARDAGLALEAVDGAALSLSTSDRVHIEHRRREVWELTAEGEQYRTQGSPEFALLSKLPPEGLELSAVVSMPNASVARNALLRTGLARTEKRDGATFLVPTPRADGATDTTQTALETIFSGCTEHLDNAVRAELKRRKLVMQRQVVDKILTRGPNFAAEVQNMATVLTAELIASGQLSNTVFKPYNFDAAGVVPPSGCSHPLMDAREVYRRHFLSMGFTEMPTDRWIESSFWNFDALIQPQQHPARDMHDTFFVASSPVHVGDKVMDPAQTEVLPPEYMAAVRRMHERGGHGSIGYRYEWSEAEARRNILRTHTTAVSCSTLYKLFRLAQKTGGRVEGKYFSIDRVFRNETLDATHLAEFHQVEGFIVGRGLTLRDLMHTISVFFRKLGMSGIRFKPAYNPYTEPSMEVFAFHPMLGRWVEVGNSGMFRPEMLHPIGFGPETTVIAWGLSLERPTMILHHVDNIRDLFGPAVSLDMLQSAHY